MMKNSKRPLVLSNLMLFLMVILTLIGSCIFLLCLLELIFNTPWYISYAIIFLTYLNFIKSPIDK